MLGLLPEAVPPEADDVEGGVKRGIPAATSVDDTSEEVAVAVTAESAVHLAWWAAALAQFFSFCLCPLGLFLGTGGGR